MPSTQKNDSLVCQYLMYTFDVCQPLLLIGQVIVGFCARIDNNPHKVHNVSTIISFFIGLSYINIMFLQV